MSDYSPGRVALAPIFYMLALRIQYYGAWALFIGSIIGWPLSQFTIARNEPPFILALSWLAIIITAMDVIQTTSVKLKQSNDE